MGQSRPRRVRHRTLESIRGDSKLIDVVDAAVARFNTSPAIYTCTGQGSTAQNFADFGGDLWSDGWRAGTGLWAFVNIASIALFSDAAPWYISVGSPPFGARVQFHTSRTSALTGSSGSDLVSIISLGSVWQIRRLTTRDELFDRLADQSESVWEEILGAGSLLELDSLVRDRSP